MYTDKEMKEYLHTYLIRCESMRSIGIVRYETDGHKPIDVLIRALRP
jgi:hypothetical protein